jgi:hypothetical protein
MSALVKSRHEGANLQCPLYPRKRTSRDAVGMSALCQKQTFCSATKKQGSSQSAARRTAEGPVLTELGKPMLGIESGKNFPARIAGCSTSNDWPLAYA